MVYIGGKSIGHIEEIQYLVMTIEKSIWTGKIKFIVDVGQGDTDTSITDEKGNDIKFVSEADVMNYLDRMGWGLFSNILSNNPSTGGLVNKLVFKRK